ncbi:MAG: hypothetical protein IT366_20435 [Candidatus Hydrogenedentes bacterium]|nr:hypothetical protein [Candidatus Hydrogenedentota bacterium]
MFFTNRDSEFDPWTWHDSKIHGFQFVLGDTDADDWTSDLVLDIDVIVEWVQCGPSAFRVAPATLTFHDVTDFALSLPGRSSGYQVISNQPSIIETKRELVTEKKAFFDQPYYAWTFKLSSMTHEGTLTFGATGFEQTLRAEPILTDRQFLPSKSRPPIV